MAALFVRKNRDGSESWRISIRRIGVPTFCLSFSTLEEAQDWIESHEEEYIKNPDSYHEWRDETRLPTLRSREFERKRNAR